MKISGKHRVDSKWAKELKNIFKEDIEGGWLSYGQILEWWPTKKEWEDMRKMDNGSKLFREYRKNFRSLDEVYDFEKSVIKDKTILNKHFTPKEAECVYLHLLNKKSRSSGPVKFAHYFQDLVKTPEFNKRVVAIRKKYGMPLAGFEKTPENVEIVERKNIFFGDAMVLGKDFGLCNMGCTLILENYIAFNIVTLSSWFFDLLDLCKIIDEGENKFKTNKEETEYNEYWTKEDEEAVEKVRCEEKKIDEKWYPVSIRVSPYASLRDILDFVKKNFHEIKMMQESYKNPSIKLGSAKRKDPITQEIYEFIWKNNNLPRKEIMALLLEKYDYDLVPDPGAIGKIISLERKRRKEV